jgi:hypothetical protein
MTQLSKHLKIVEQGDSATIVYTNINNSTYELKFDNRGMYINNVEISDYIVNIVYGILSIPTTLAPTTTVAPTTTGATTTIAPTTTAP